MARLLPVALLGAAAAAAVGVVVGRASAPDALPPAPEKSAAPRDDSKDREIAQLRRRVGDLEQALREASRPKEEPATTSTAEEQLRQILKGDVSQERAAQAATLAARYKKVAEAAAASADMRAAKQVQEEIERERRVRDDAERGGAMALVRSIHQSKTTVVDLVGSSFDFGKLFVRTTEGPVVNGPDTKTDGPIADGTTVRFPAGFHKWSVAALGSKPAFPGDLVLEGAGMDATIVRIGEIDTNSEIRSLTFRDMTIDPDGCFTDLGTQEPATIRVERCRVISFDTGAGGSNMLDGGVAAFYASDSRFETGFGHSPGTGRLVEARGGTMLARFERCTILGPMYDPGFSTSASTTIVFAECRFVDMGEGLVNAMESPPDGVRFVSCTRETRDPAAAADERRRFLDGIAGTDATKAEIRKTYYRILDDKTAGK